MICNNCGSQNPPGANFCSTCGNSLTDAPSDATITFHVADLGLGLGATEQKEAELTDAITHLAPGTAMLFAKRGSNIGATYLLDTDITRAGRQPDSEIFLDDVTVSRKHAEFRREGSSFVMKDVGSLNGTYVNGEITDTATLVHGDEVQIGKFKLVFLTGSSDH